MNSTSPISKNSNEGEGEKATDNSKEITEVKEIVKEQPEIN